MDKEYVVNHVANQVKSGDLRRVNEAPHVPKKRYNCLGSRNIFFCISLINSTYRVVVGTHVRVVVRGVVRMAPVAPPHTAAARRRARRVAVPVAAREHTVTYTIYSIRRVHLSLSLSHGNISNFDQSRQYEQTLL